MRLRWRVATSSTTPTVAAFLNGNCGSGSELGSGDTENAGPAYTSTAGLTGAAAIFLAEEEEGLPWCLRLAGGDFLVALGLGFRCVARILRGGRRMLCGRSTSVAINGEGDDRKEEMRGRKRKVQSGFD